MLDFKTIICYYSKYMSNINNLRKYPKSGFYVIEMIDHFACTLCGSHTHNKDSYKSSTGKNNGRCKECQKFDRKCNYYKNYDKIQKQVKKYDKKNKRQLKKRINKYQKSEHGKLTIKLLRKENFKKRYYNDPLFKLANLIRCRLRHFLKLKNLNKKYKMSQYLGCTLGELKKHLESQFKKGMTWENQGKWHIDHIIPLASAKTEKEIYKLCHYSNLQPLWARDNIKKNDKIIL